MKKLFLAVALVAASLSANAVGLDFTGGGVTVATTGATPVLPSSFTLSNATSAVNGTAIEVSVGATANGSITLGASGVSFAYNNTTAAAKIVFKFYDTYFQPNGTNCVLNIATQVGDVVVISTKSYSSGAATLAITGADKSAATLLASTAETLTLTATGTQIAITNTANKYQVTKISINGAATVTNATDAISSKLLRKAGDVLANPTNLDVTITSIGGASFTSSASDINISALPAGVYVASTKEGSLKFIK